MRRTGDRVEEWSGFFQVQQGSALARRQDRTQYHNLIIVIIITNHQKEHVRILLTILFSIESAMPEMAALEDESGPDELSVAAAIHMCQMMRRRHDEGGHGGGGQGAAG